MFPFLYLCVYAGENLLSRARSLIGAHNSGCLHSIYIMSYFVVAHLQVLIGIDVLVAKILYSNYSVCLGAA